MSVTSALYTGISGLAANGEAMSVIGNNISNVNTTGFKQGRMLFSDVLSSTISGGSQIGRGVQIQSVENQFTQGSFESTESSTDLAIQGDSFFILQSNAGRQYTRAGAFHFDKDQILVNPEGSQVLGYGIIPATGQSNGVLGAIDLTNFATTPPNMTANVNMVVNLDSTQAIPGTTASTKTANIAMTGNLNTGTTPATAVATAYDDAGIAHAATVTMTYSGAGNIWNWSAAIAGATTGSPITGTANFSGVGGALSAQAYASTNTITLNGAAQTVAVDFSAMVQTAAASAPVATADGVANTLPWDAANPVATSNFSTSMTIYDSQGNAHTATTYFRKTAANSWDWHVIIPDATAGSPVNGTLAFNASGALVTQTPAATAAQNITFAGGVTAPQAILIDLGVGATTQYASPSIVTSQTQDGYYQGTLMKVTVDDKGYVNGVYSNGQLQKIAQVSLAKFSAATGLFKAGGTMFEETLTSGQPQLSTASTPGVGKILSNSLEQSNVDMAAQFVKMITTQRGYSANSKTITTADEMLQEVLNLKR